VQRCYSFRFFTDNRNQSNIKREVTIKYEGEVQNMKDGLGNPVYPLMYNGTTYLPIRAVSNMLNIPIEWEAATKTVILGTEEKQPKSVLSFKAKSSNFASKVTDKGSLVIKGNSGEEIKYNDGICYKIGMQHIPRQLIKHIKLK